MNKCFFPLATSIFLGIPSAVMAQTANKEMYLPPKVYRVPENNDYANDTSEYNYKRMVKSENLALFWSKEFGDDPALNPELSKRFKIDEALKECERFYNYYVNDLKFV